MGSNPQSTLQISEAEVFKKLDRLKQIRQNIPKGDWEARRLWLLCIQLEIEHLSKWEGIDAYTTRGVDRLSAAVKIVEKQIGPVKDSLKRSRNIFQVMKEGGPAAVFIDDDGRPPTM